jgi:hypothetical protein
LGKTKLRKVSRPKTARQYSQFAGKVNRLIRRSEDRRDEPQSTRAGNYTCAERDLEHLSLSCFENLDQIAAALANTGASFHFRGWVWGTGGNLSAVVQRDPLLLAITASGEDKGALPAEHILMIDENAHVMSRPSAKPIPLENPFSFLTALVQSR